MQSSSAGGWPKPDIAPQAVMVVPHGVTKGALEHRSRSPSSHSAGVPANHFLHGVATGASSNVSPGLTSVDGDQAWFTGDTTLDFWVLRTILNPCARHGLTFLPVEDRKHIIRGIHCAQSIIISRAVSENQFLRSMLLIQTISGHLDHVFQWSTGLCRDLFHAVLLCQSRSDGPALCRTTVCRFPVFRHVLLELVLKECSLID
jgi:hypothetical protein